MPNLKPVDAITTLAVQRANVNKVFFQNFEVIFEYNVSG